MQAATRPDENEPSLVHPDPGTHWHIESSEMKLRYNIYYIKENLKNVLVKLGTIELVILVLNMLVTEIVFELMPSGYDKHMHNLIQFGVSILACLLLVWPTLRYVVIRDYRRRKTKLVAICIPFILVMWLMMGYSSSLTLRLHRKITRISNVNQIKRNPGFCYYKIAGVEIDTTHFGVHYHTESSPRSGTMMYFNGVVPVKSQKRVWLCFDVREHCLLWYSGEIMRKFVNRATAEMKNYSSEDSTYIEVLDDKYGYNRSAFRMGISDDPHTKYGEPVFVRAFNLDKQYLKEILLTLGIFVISIIWYYIVLKGAEYLPKKKIGGTGSFV